MHNIGLGVIIHLEYIIYQVYIIHKSVYHPPSIIYQVYMKHKRMIVEVQS